MGGSIELTENQKTWNRLVTIMIIWEEGQEPGTGQDRHQHGAG